MAAINKAFNIHIMMGPASDTLTLHSLFTHSSLTLWRVSEEWVNVYRVASRTLLPLSLLCTSFLFIYIINKKKRIVQQFYFFSFYFDSFSFWGLFFIFLYKDKRKKSTQPFISPITLLFFIYYIKKRRRGEGWRADIRLFFIY